ncbi:unnamed protein product [Pleuronectes platessa]|uniref:Rab3GAP catalytic subunit C-terminal domain-containing protein n=1 Tax=Pleuronectes platessa TaxID=8262 RepID=A0A9N7TPG1_PLEPL|nr:unnamed protein product [Pleuronectes platessa]
MILCRFVSSLLEEPEVVVSGAGQGPAGSIIHRLFVSAQRATLLTPQDEDFGNVRKPNGSVGKLRVKGVSRGGADVKDSMISAGVGN